MTIDYSQFSDGWRKHMRRNLVKHIWDGHGRIRLDDAFSNGERLTLEELDAAHRILHIDDYACPPHEHQDDPDAFAGGIVHTLPDGYLQSLYMQVRGYEKTEDGWIKVKEDSE